MSAGVAIGCWSDDGTGGGGLLDGGEADVGGAMHVAGLALGAGTSTTSQLTEEEEEEEEEGRVRSCDTLRSLKVLKDLCSRSFNSIYCKHLHHRFSNPYDYIGCLFLLSRHCLLGLT